MFAAESSIAIDDVGDFDRDAVFSVGVWVRPGDKLNDGMIVAKLTEKGARKGGNSRCKVEEN